MTYKVAAEIFGSGSSEQDAVRGGWEQVGIKIAVQKKGRKK